MKDGDNCCCGSGKRFNKCCGRFLEQGAHAKTPEQLMRSRFSAFYLGGYGAYLVSTWFDSAKQGLSETALSKRDTAWLRLEVLQKSQRGNLGFVEFKAYFVDQNGKEACHHEKSEFQRIEGLWFYDKGEVLPVSEPQP